MRRRGKDSEDVEIKMSVERLGRHRSKAACSCPCSTRLTNAMALARRPVQGAQFRVCEGDGTSQIRGKGARLMIMRRR
jgi:hypothetical protein